jgi:hypothetical protein
MTLKNLQNYLTGLSITMPLEGLDYIERTKRIVLDSQLVQMAR